jgi:HEAT repeat protein
MTIDAEARMVAASALGWAVAGRSAPPPMDALPDQLRAARIAVLALPVCDDATRRRAAALIDELLLLLVGQRTG